MFPIHFNSPYRKKDGSLTTMEKALDGAGADLDLIDLDDVAITDPADGDGLIYDNTAKKWKNIPIISRILTLFNAWKKNGAYNILINNRTTETVSGNLFTVNSDKSITVTIPENPTTTNFYLLGSDATAKMKLSAGTYKLVGCPNGGSSSSYYIQGFGNHDYTSGAGILDTGNGVIFTLTQENEVNFFISIRDTFTSGGTFTFKPMITTDPNATYDDYVPGTKTNRELTESAIFGNLTRISSPSVTLSMADATKTVNITKPYKMYLLVLAYNGSYKSTLLFPNDLNYYIDGNSNNSGYNSTIEASVNSTNDTATIHLIQVTGWTSVVCDIYGIS